MKEERRKKERNIFVMQTGRKQNKKQNKTRQKKINKYKLPKTEGKQNPARKHTIKVKQNKIKTSQVNTCVCVYKINWQVVAK